jgi:enoyl-CoA hydratase/carnithine racemase
MNYQQIIYNVSNNILTVTLNRPDHLNAFTCTMRDELIDAFDRADADDSVRAIVVTGAGRAFCAGADLSGGGDTFKRDIAATETEPVHRDGGGLLTLRIFDCNKPVIAAINGPAVGIGVTMILAMDIRVAADSARFGFVFSRRGIVPEACSSWFLPRIVGISQALEWTYSGRVFPATEALAGGLIRNIFPPTELLREAYALATGLITDNSAISVALTRHMMWKMMGADHPMEAHKIDSRGIYHLGRSPEVKEGIEAFLEKRSPRFPGKISSDMPDYFPWWSPRRFE